MNSSTPDSLPHDIEDLLNVFAVPLDILKPFCILLAFIAAIFAVYFFYRWLKRRRKKTIEPSLPEKIAQLATDDAREFYARLTALILTFFERRDQKHYRQMTPKELDDLELVTATDKEYFQNFLQKSFSLRFQNISAEANVQEMESDRAMLLKIIQQEKAAGRYAE